MFERIGYPLGIGGDRFGENNRETLSLDLSQSRPGGSWFPETACATNELEISIASTPAISILVAILARSLMMVWVRFFLKSCALSTQNSAFDAWFINYRPYAFQ